MHEIRKYGILNEDLEKIIFELRKNLRIESIILFGSRAKGTFENGSDIDIAIKGSDLNLNDILDANVRVEELYLPYKIDLVIYDKISEIELINHIDRVGIQLFEMNIEK